MVTVFVRMVYPPELLDVPVVNQLIRRFEITLNINRAEIGTESGWIEAHLTGKPSEVDSALAWLREKGIRVEHLET